MQQSRATYQQNRVLVIFAVLEAAASGAGSATGSSRESRTEDGLQLHDQIFKTSKAQKLSGSDVVM